MLTKLVLVISSLNSKKLVSSGSSDCLLQIDEQATNVDSIEGRRLGETSLITEQNDAITRREDNRVDSIGIQLISLNLAWVVGQLNCVQDSTSSSSSR